MVAESIHLPGIVGAFLAGLAVNAAVHNKSAEEKLEFFGNSLFIPVFFIVTGSLADVHERHPPKSRLGDSGHSGVSRRKGNRITDCRQSFRIFVGGAKYHVVAATLAAALVAYDTYNHSGQRLLDLKMMNVVLVLMLTTAIL